MNIVRILKIAKPITSFVAGIGTGTVVNTAVSYLAPANMTRYQKFAFSAGGFFIGSAAIGIVCDRVEKDFDTVLEGLESKPESDDTQELLNSAVDKLTAREYQALAYVLSQNDADQKEED